MADWRDCWFPVARLNPLLWFLSPGSGELCACLWTSKPKPPSSAYLPLPAKSHPCSSPWLSNICEHGLLLEERPGEEAWARNEKQDQGHLKKESQGPRYWEQVWKGGLLVPLGLWSLHSVGRYKAGGGHTTELRPGKKPFVPGFKGDPMYLLWTHTHTPLERELAKMPPPHPKGTMAT